jgi:opacity protein-like surface antigen
MGRSKIAALVGAALFFLPSAGVFAADIPEIPPPAHFGGNWYLKGYIGMANQHFGGLDHPLFATTPGFVFLDSGHFAAVPLFGVGIGWQHSDHVRFDLTGEYRGKSSFSALDRYDTGGAPATNTNAYTAKKSELLFLANGYYDFNPIHGITPYVGAGIGVSYNSIYDFLDTSGTGGGGWADTGHKLSLAWALHAGAASATASSASAMPRAGSCEIKIRTSLGLVWTV